MLVKNQRVRKEILIIRYSFTSIREIGNAEDILQNRILSKFGIEAFLLTRVCLESNGFSGCEPVLNQDGILEHYSTV
jgi:hypothetical protein